MRAAARAGAGGPIVSMRDLRSLHASLGMLMLIHAPWKAFEESVTESAFLRDAEPHDQRLANFDAGLATVAVTHTEVGTVAVAVARAAAHWR